MLTTEVIKTLGVSDDIAEKIATLSANDENAVIGKKLADVHSQYDADVYSTTGIQREQSEKTYDYVKRVLSKFKTEVGELPTVKSSLQKLEQEKKELEETIKSGKGSEAISQQLKDAQSMIDSLKKTNETTIAELTNKFKEKEAEVSTIKVNSVFEKSLASIKLKEEYTDSIKDILINNAKSTILASYKTDWVDGKMIFRDSNGEIVRNPNNLQNPYTAEELLKENLKDALFVETDKSGGGTGGKNPDTGDILDISSAKDQYQADEIFSKYLMKKGYSRGSVDFDVAFTKLRKDNPIH